MARSNRLGIEAPGVDLVIGPSIKRPEDDEALRLAIEADRARPESGKDAAHVLRMLGERKNRVRAKRARRRTAITSK